MCCCRQRWTSGGHNAIVYLAAHCLTREWQIFISFPLTLAYIYVAPLCVASLYGKCKCILQSQKKHPHSGACVNFQQHCMRCPICTLPCYVVLKVTECMFILNGHDYMFPLNSSTTDKIILVLTFSSRDRA